MAPRNPKHGRPERECSVCKQTFPNTREYFHSSGNKDRQGNIILKSVCRSCNNMRGGHNFYAQERARLREALEKAQRFHGQPAFIIDEDRGVVQQVEYAVAGEMSLERWRNFGAEGRQEITKGAPIVAIRSKKGVAR